MYYAIHTENHHDMASVGAETTRLTYCDQLWCCWSEATDVVILQKEIIVRVGIHLWFFLSANVFLAFLSYGHYFWIIYHIQFCMIYPPCRGSRYIGSHYVQLGWDMQDPLLLERNNNHIFFRYSYKQAELGVCMHSSYRVKEQDLVQRIWQKPDLLWFDQFNP